MQHGRTLFTTSGSLPGNMTVSGSEALQAVLQRLQQAKQNGASEEQLRSLITQGSLTLLSYKVSSLPNSAPRHALWYCQPDRALRCGPRFLRSTVAQRWLGHAYKILSSIEATCSNPPDSAGW